MKILIVEDELIIAQYMKDILEEAGHEVLEPCVNYTKAVFSYILNKPDLILLDINLEGNENGFYVANKIRKQSNVAIIFVSGNTSKEFIQKAKDFSPNGFLCKPVNPIDLKLSVEIGYNSFKTESRIRSEIIDLVKETERKDTEFLLGSFIHDIMQPVVSLQHQIIKIPNLDPNTHLNLDARVEVVIDLLISFRKMVTGDPEPTDISIEDLAKKINLVNSYNCLSNGVHLNINTVDFKIHAFESDMIRIFSNFIHNSVYAVKGTSDPWIKIDFQLEMGRVKCLITDSGLGIPEDIADKIFNKEFTTKGHEGTGMGLFGARETLAAAGFEMELNRSHTNTQFIIYF